jgi:hypothetical protein
MLAGSASVALFAYSGWAFALPTVHRAPWRPLTIVFFAACLPDTVRSCEPEKEKRPRSCSRVTAG